VADELTRLAIDDLRGVAGAAQLVALCSIAIGQQGVAVEVVAEGGDRA